MIAIIITLITNMYDPHSFLCYLNNREKGLRNSNTRYKFHILTSYLYIFIQVRLLFVGRSGEIITLGKP